MRNRIIIIASALVLLIGLSVAVLFLVNKSPKIQNVVLKLANTNTSATTTNTNGKNTNTASDESNDHDAIRFTARTFTELYGSFSNENGGSNLLEAATYATPTYAASLRQQAVVKQAAPRATAFSSVVSHALVFTFINQTDTTASLTVTTQQVTTNGTASTTGTKELVLDVKKSGTKWLVDAAVWK